MKQQSALQERYLQTLKHTDTEETIDLCFYRPLGFRVALLGEKYGWTPNAITIFGIFVGVCCGLLLYPDNLWLNLLGMLCLVIADLCDSADGQLARMTKQYSRVGRILDCISSDFWFIAIYVCIALRLSTQLGWMAWVLPAAAGLCHAFQASMADHYRQFHLFFTKDSKNCELDTAADLRRQAREISFFKEPMRKTFIWLYSIYTAIQEINNPQMWKLRRKFRDNPEILTPEFCETMRQKTLPLMKWTNVLTFNWRAISLFVAVLCQKLWLYPLLEITVFNVILIYMVARHEMICRGMINKKYKNYNIYERC